MLSINPKELLLCLTYSQLFYGINLGFLKTRTNKELIPWESIDQTLEYNFIINIYDSHYLQKKL